MSSFLKNSGTLKASFSDMEENSSFHTIAWSGATNWSDFV